MSFGERINQLRTSSKPKLSMNSFGERLGVSKDVIANLEYNRVEPSESMLLLISKTYGVRSEWLKTGEEPMYPPEADDFLERITRIMEGESPNKRQLIEMIMDMPDELLDWVYQYYQQKKNGE